ncbi:hypothetical protein AD998_21785 [bacterium 336/3]|nr:hypothetical protein AD998_21785 [bacterium 336/3]
MTEAMIQSSIEEIVSLALSGKGAEAWEKFYHEEVEKIDLDGISIKGKTNVLQVNHVLLANITEVRAYTHIGNLVKGNRSFIIWDVDFDVKDGDTIKTTEVCIQDWQDGKVIKEQFFA